MTSPVKLNACRGKLRFQISRTFTKHYYPELKSNRFIYLGVEDDEKGDGTNRSLANLKLKELKQDLISGNFDPNNEEKYHVINLVIGVQRKDLPSLHDLVEKHILFKRKMGIIEEATYIRDKLHIRTCQRLSEDITKIDNILDELDSLDCADSTKKDTLQKIAAAIIWGIKKDILPNKFEDCIEKISDRKQIIINRIKKYPSKRCNSLHGKESKERYFNIEEVEIIIQAFYEKFGDTSRPQMIEAAFRLGCRPGELTALKWEDLDYIYLDDSKVMTINVDKAYSVELKKSKNVKNYKPRMIPISKKAHELFERIKPSDYKANDLIFTHF